MTTLLKNCKIYDGTGTEPFLGDVLLDGDRIADVGQSISCAADHVIDLAGKSVSPGFIDIHSHNDWFVVKKDPVPYFEPFIRQGITSYVTGNCGISAIGFDKDTPHMKTIGAGLFGYKDDCSGIYHDANAFFEAIDGKNPCNIAVLAGHCTSRASVTGVENRPLTPEEEQRMLNILEENLKQGAAGISLGLMYDPGIFGTQDELKKIADLCVKYDKPLTVHPRAESKVSMAYPQLLGRSHLLRAFDELAEIAKGTNLKLQYSHAIFVGRATIGDKPELMKMIDQLCAEGVRVQYDIYNELEGVSVLTVILPGWYKGLTPAQKKAPINRLKLAVQVFASTKLLGFGFKDMTVAYIGPGYEKYEGKTVHQLAKEYGKSDLDMYLQLCDESNFNGRINMGPYTTEEIIHDFERDPRCLYMTDAWVEPYGVQNSALYDCFPKFLRDSLLGIGDTLPQTVRRMTGASADRFMLKERGYLKKGYYADVTVFDEEALRSATPDQEKSFGIEKVFINGHLVLDEDKLDPVAASTSGMAMRV